MTANTYGVEVEAQFIAKIEDGEWPHFLWRVTLRRNGLQGAGPGGEHKLVIEAYRMGLGHIQTPCGKRIGVWHGETPCQHARCQGKRVPTPPDLYTILCSLKADDTQGRTFDEWCGDYGMDTDSRKAMSMYLACQQSEADSRKFFGSDWTTLVEDEDYI
jgi:hypothetical protein